MTVLMCLCLPLGFFAQAVAKMEQNKQGKPTPNATSNKLKSGKGILSDIDKKFSMHVDAREQY